MSRPTRLVLAALWLGALLSLGGPLAAGPAGIEPSMAQAAGQGNQGLQGGWAVSDTGQVSFTHSSYQQFETMAAAGAGWVRINFRLGGCFKDWTSRGCNGRTALQTYEEVVAEAGRRQLKVVAVLSGEAWHGTQADWTAGNAENSSRANGNNRYIQSFVKSAVTPLYKQFGGRIGHWEIWNEPNAYTTTDRFNNPIGGTYIYPSNFAQLLVQSHQAIRQAKQAAWPSPVVVAGAIFSHDPEGRTLTVVERGVRRTVVRRGTLRGTRLAPGSRQPGADGATVAAAPACETVPSGADYLCKTYEMGRSKANWDGYRQTSGTYPLDRIGQTIYVDQGGVTTSDKLGTHLREIRDAYIRYEGSTTTKKTWVEEVGWPTPSEGDSAVFSRQAENLRIAFGTFPTLGFVERAFWFNVQDIPEASPVLYHGLVDGGGVHKPSFAAYQSAAVY